jgi:hypothetical protein
MLGGHWPKLYAIAGVALAVAAPPRAGSGGVTVALPPGWHATRPDQGRNTQPLTRLVVSSGPIAPRLTGTCHVQVSDYTFPATAVAIVVVEWTKPIGVPLGRLGRRPARFTVTDLPIRRPPAIECFSGPGGAAQWSARGHDFAAYVLLGRKAPLRLATRARSVLDTLRIAPRK